MRHIAHTSKLGSLRGVLHKSVATQTVSAPKVGFFFSEVSRAVYIYIYIAIGFGHVQLVDKSVQMLSTPS